jgi:acyl-CoA thioesterase FadM
MRWLRLIYALLSARFRCKLSINGESRIPFAVWLTDIDASVMNHAAMMTVMEMGRIDFMVRSGFFKLARIKKWYFPSRSISVQFIRPLKLFQKATLTTRIFHVDDHWIYIEQKIVRHDKLIAACIVKSTVKKGRETVPTSEIAKILELGEMPKEGREVVEAMEQENNLASQRLSEE